MFCPRQPAKVGYFRALYRASVTDWNSWEGHAQHKWEATPTFPLSRYSQSTKLTLKHPFPSPSGAVASITSFWYTFPMVKVTVVLILVMILWCWRSALLCFKYKEGSRQRSQQCMCVCTFGRSLLVHCSADSHSLEAIAQNQQPLRSCLLEVATTLSCHIQSNISLLPHVKFCLCIVNLTTTPETWGMGFAESSLQAWHLDGCGRHVLGMKLASWDLELDGGAKQLPHRLQLNVRLHGSQQCGGILKGAVERMLRRLPHQGGSRWDAVTHPRKGCASSPRKARGRDAEYNLEHPKSLLIVLSGRI